MSDDASVALRIIVDTSSVTVFSGKGEVVLTDQIFRSRPVKALRYTVKAEI
ncbi:MAG: GH32 C-terminal domain-containing protein [Enterobacteriaceae bacterium]